MHLLRIQVFFILFRSLHSNNLNLGDKNVFFKTEVFLTVRFATQVDWLGNKIKQCWQKLNALNKAKKEPLTSKRVRKI